MDEHVHHHRDDDPHQAHQQEAAEAREVLLGDVAEQAEAAEGRSRHHEGGRQRNAGVGQHPHAKAGADQRDHQPVVDPGRAGARIAHAEHGAQDHHQGREADDGAKQGEAGEAAVRRGHVQQVANGREVRRQIGQEARQQQAQGHLVVDAEHERAQPRVHRHIGCAGGNRTRKAAVIVAHRETSLCERPKSGSLEISARARPGARTSGKVNPQQGVIRP